jgi:6-pyruvoyltetrahydropterin/6-carboxytetrahydropterin synthase
MSIFQSTKIIELGSCAFRQPNAAHSHCKFLHGYRLISKIWFGCSGLDDKNWVVDFGGLKGLKEILEKQFDHTLCAAADDPLLPLFQQLHAAGGCDLRVMDKGVGIERCAEWVFEAADAYVRNISLGRCWVERAEVWEHEKNSAIYEKSAVVVSGSASLCSPSLQLINEAPILNPVKLQFIEPAQPAVDPRAPIAAAVGNVTSEITQGHNITKPAPVGNTYSTGWNNPFQGTSWGA